MGLMLCPADDDVDSPDVSWSSYGFDLYRQWLAGAEEIAVAETAGSGGARPWSDVTTALTPLLDHPDDEGELSPAQCAAMLPRLAAIAGDPPHMADDDILRRRVDDTRELIGVMTYCVDRDVPLVFC
ncbi:hypothetical protein [Streptomyces sp. NPDC047123]|uniref:hypothetical protein n=1 Tax=Streptomyces sp. NPDC047123 TaxID=3155622 RepID=UPI0033D29C17